MHDDCNTPDSPPTKRKFLSGAEKARRRVAKGLPAYTPAGQECERRKGQRRYAQRRALIDAVKMQRGCADCGYAAHPAALEFDHLPGTEKLGTLARMVWRGNPFSRLVEEMAKCEVVCANCHAIRTVERTLTEPFDEERSLRQKKGAG